MNYFNKKKLCVIENECNKKRIKAFLAVFLSILIMLNLISPQALAKEGVIQEIKDILKNYYIEEVPDDVLNGESVNEVIKNLNDPYTQVIDEEDYNTVLNGTFFGLGVTIKPIKTGGKVTSVFVNSPAMKAGLQVQDIIVSAGDNSIQGLSEADAINVLNGKLGIYNSLKVIRDNKLLTVEVALDNVNYPTVYTNITGSNIGYMRILSFGKDTLTEFENKINSPEMKAASSYILDLRNNQGGYLYSAVEIAGYFSKNNPVAVFQLKNGEKYDFKASKNSSAINKPVVFLVNEYTASAAELLVACAQDYGTAIIVGKKTYGKGVAQSTFKLSDGSMFKITTLKFFSPKGRDINKGIYPDINILNIDASYAAELLVESSGLQNRSGVVKVGISGKNYYIDLKKIKDSYYSEAYRQIISQASTLDASNYSYINESARAAIRSYPIINLKKVPKTYYQVGDRVTFQFNAPNYNGLVQYRAMLWNDNTNKYIDLWNTKDRFYNQWIPRGKDTFTISFPVTNAGNYKLKVFVKRKGILNSKAAITGMNCDSYVYEIPFRCHALDSGH